MFPIRDLFACSCVLAALLGLASPAHATDEQLELWLNPSVSVDLTDRTGLELETAQRFRPAPDDDTYFFRLWVKRELSDAVEIGGAVEQRFEGEDEETRFLQQVSFDLGQVDLRTRLEQRMVSSDPQTGWRLRQRIGTAIPLSRDEGGWTFVANTEAFFTLRATSPDGLEGFTRLRTFVGVEREFGPVELSLGYLREHNIVEDGPDRIGNAPFVGLSYAFD